MVLRMVFCGFLRVLSRIQITPMRDVEMMPCRFMMTLFVMLGGCSAP
jgi:hypothetical protein